MARKSSPATIASLFIFFLMAASPVLASLPFSIAVYRPSGITLDGPKNLSTLREIGFDGYYFNGHWAYEFSSPGWHDRNFPAWAEACAENNMTFIAGQYWVYGRELPFYYSTAVDQFGNVEPTTPSPISSGWWRNMIEAAAVHIANLSLRYPIWGIIWDFELYDHKAFKHKYYSFDDEALQGFAEDTGYEIPRLEPSQRRDWLRNNGLLEEFQRWEENRAYELAKDVADKVHAINPKLVLGLFPLEDVWFHWAVLKGFGTPEAPAGAWTGWQTYGGCSEEMATSFKERIREKGIHADFVVGLAGADLAPFEESVRNSEAVWIYPFGEVSPGLQTRISIVRRYLYFNQTHLNRLEVFSVGPDVSARPYGGPAGIVSMILAPYEGGKTLNPSINFTTDGSVVLVCQENLAPVVISGPSISVRSEDLPCLIYGLKEEDLTRMKVEFTRRELTDLQRYYSSAGLGDLTEVLSALDFAAGKADTDPEVASRLIQAREAAYDEAASVLSTVLQQPGSLTVPPAAKTKLWLGSLMMSKNRMGQGRMYLYDGLRTWYSVDEALPYSSILVSVLAAPLILVCSSPKRAGDRGPGFRRR